MSDAPTPTNGMRQVEARLGRPVPEYLRDAYQTRELAQVDIVSELGWLGVTVNASTVSRWMARCGIETRVIGHRKRTRRTA
jgi:hypothetical protein